MSTRPTPRADLETTIEMNAAAHVNPTARRILDDLDRQAEKLLRKLADDEAAARDGFDTRLSVLSLYGGEAAVRDLVRQAEFHRVRGAVRRAA